MTQLCWKCLLSLSCEHGTSAENSVQGKLQKKLCLPVPYFQTYTFCKLQVTQPNEDMLTVTVERQAGRHLGIRLTGNLSEPGIYIADIQEGSAMAMEGQLRKFDHILFINGQDVRNADLSQASALIQVCTSKSFFLPLFVIFFLLRKYFVFKHEFLGASRSYFSSFLFLTSMKFPYILHQLHKIYLSRLVLH